jgi:hypothetical protein
VGSSLWGHVAGARVRVQGWASKPDVPRTIWDLGWNTGRRAQLKLVSYAIVVGPGVVLPIGDCTPPVGSSSLGWTGGYDGVLSVYWVPLRTTLYIELRQHLVPTPGKKIK